MSINDKINVNKRDTLKVIHSVELKNKTFTPQRHCY